MSGTEATRFTRVIAFDPGKKCTGYAVLDRRRGLIQHGYFDLRRAGQAVLAWTRLLYEGVSAVLANFANGGCLAVVEVPSRFMHVRARRVEAIPGIATRQLQYGIAVGVVVAACIARATAVAGVTPAQWKGNKTKRRTMAELRAIYGLTSVRQDEADAIMMADWALNNAWGLELAYSRKTDVAA